MAGLLSPYRCCTCGSCSGCGSCLTPWSPDDNMRSNFVPKRGDFRDHLPLEFETIRELYQPYVKEGAWTLGLCEMWFPKSKAVKRSVHVPCWDSFKLNPLRWRGIVLGRTCRQCFWTGMHETRWARAAFAGAPARKYSCRCCADVTKGDTTYQSNLEALCWSYCAMGIVCGFGITEIFARLGTCNFAACFSCFSRARLRREFHLPPTCGLPMYLDDCCVHFACMYCASHQEIREMAVRGVDGPGLHILDVLPDAWDHVEGHEEVVAKRRAQVAEMLANPPQKYLTIMKKRQVAKEAAANGQESENGGGGGGGSSSSGGGGKARGMGWVAHYMAPLQQEMPSRELGGKAEEEAPAQQEMGRASGAGSSVQANEGSASAEA